MHPKVSFIIPVYKTETYLDRCVQSVINQTCKDIEIILVDDGSPDNSPELCDKWAEYDKRIRVVHKANGGLSDSRNVGIKMSNGEYVCFVDSDDFVEKDLVEKTYKTAIDYDADLVVYSNFLVDKHHRKKVQNLTSSRDVFLGPEQMHNFFNESIGSLPQSHYDYDIGFAPWGKIYRRRVLVDNKVLFKSERKLIYEDLMFLLDLIPIVKCAVVEHTPLYNYCQNNGTLTRSIDRTRFWKIKKQYFFLRNTEPYKTRIFNNKETMLRFNRTMLSYIRNCVIQASNDEKAMIDIKKICDDELCQEILQKYPIRLLPPYQAIFAWCLRKKMARVLLIITHLNSLRKNTR